MAGINSRLKNYFSEARQEFRHVNWPNRQEAIRLTGIVIGLSVGVAIFLGVCDLIFAQALRSFILR
ncbi:MAG: preprotein translocase subunit SecE [Candidatus Liptonbacteria bacterium]|nr:preprotein translocase subunit SecE [Candidatus Liptonbacteria bacterium]